MARTPAGASLKAIVTYLDTTRPPRQLSPLPVNVQAALMRVPKIPLHFYRYLYWQIGREWHWVYRLRMKDDELSAIVHDPRTEIRVLSVDGAPAGMFELSRVSDTTTNLVYFGLTAHVRGRGLGRWMLGQAMMAAFEAPISLLTVSTNTLDHPTALSLYQKMGFSPVSQSEAIVRPLTDAEILAMAKAK